MTSKTYYLFRHGATYFSEPDIPYGDQKLTAEILPTARPAIERLGKYLKDIPTDINFRSNVYRCQQTADIITEVAGKDFIVDKRLTEYYEETFDQLRDRVNEFLTEIEKSDYKVIAICTHGAVISAMKHLLLSGSYELQDLMDYPKTGVIWKIESGQVEEFNFRD